MREKVLAILLSLALALPAAPAVAFAAGNSNMDSASGGGYSGDGVAGESFWNGESGVRLTVVDALDFTTKGRAIDYTYATPAEDIIHFGKKSKMEYGSSRVNLSQIIGNYTHNTPITSASGQTMPRIVSGGGNNIQAIKNYFGSREVADMVASDFGMSFEALTEGYCLLFVEPLLFIKFEGKNYTMTAHETALYNQQLANTGARTLRDSFVGNVTHRDLPLSMFLERDDLVFVVPPGSKSGKQTDERILSYFGLGTVRFISGGPMLTPAPKPAILPAAAPAPAAISVEYRPDTDVITAVTLNAPTDTSFPTYAGYAGGGDPFDLYEGDDDDDFYDPYDLYEGDDGGGGAVGVGTATVTFTVHKATGDEIHTMSDVAIPAGGSQVVWAKWHTPQAEQEIQIDVRSNLGWLTVDRVDAKIVGVGDGTPPDPKADDLRPMSFNELMPVPSKAQSASASWAVWRAVLESRQEWTTIDVLVTDDDEEGEDEDAEDDDEGEDEDEAIDDEDDGEEEYITIPYLATVFYYDFVLDVYTVTLDASSAIKPDAKVPTAKWNAASGYTMKSGYGFNNTVEAKLAGGAPNSHVVAPQTAVSWFPEFGYASYSRLLEVTERDPTTSKLEFRNNKYSTYNLRVHYTPIWYPDAPYRVYTWLLDAWTPAGMLSMNLSGGLTIDGALFEDWHIAPIN